MAIWTQLKRLWDLLILGIEGIVRVFRALQELREVMEKVPLDVWEWVVLLVHAIRLMLHSWGLLG